MGRLVVIDWQKGTDKEVRQGDQEHEQQELLGLKVKRRALRLVNGIYKTNTLTHHTHFIQEFIVIKKKGVNVMGQ